MGEKKQRELYEADERAMKFCSEFYQMNYIESRIQPPDILATGEHLGLRFFVVTYGTHPCAYISVGGTYLEGVDDILDNRFNGLKCHGGITFSEDSICPYVVPGSGKWVIGWDYTHYGDYDGRKGSIGSIIGGRKWRTAEIVMECIAAIEEIRRHRIANAVCSFLSKVRFWR